jgi:ABC-type sugar transport system ATPase subunit
MASINQEIRYLSGGNQQKTIIARWLLNNPDILLLDEPTHGVDVGAKQEIYQIIDTLAKSGISVIFVSSEMPEILMVSDRVAIMHGYTIKNILSKEGMTQEKIMRYMANQEDDNRDKRSGNI